MFRSNHHAQTEEEKQARHEEGVKNLVAWLKIFALVPLGIFLVLLLLALLGAVLFPAR